jgi:aspartate racemase
MRVIGIIGGSSDQATADYYRQLNAAVKRRRGGFHTAELVINSLDFALAERWVREGSWEEAASDLKRRAQSLARAGAGLVICVSNTLHRCADAFMDGVSIPFLHIVDPTGAAIRAAGLRTVALFGTAPVMSEDYLQRRYRERFGVDIVVPEPEVRRDLDRIIFHELCQGRCLPESKAFYLRAIGRCRERGAEGVILGCTEIPLLIRPEDLPGFPQFDTCALHVEAAVDWALAAP